MLNILLKAAREGGKVLMDYYGKKMQVNSKPNPADFVTAADVKSQKVIIQSLLRSMAKKGYKKEEIGFIAEENFVRAGAHTFIIDPLDGTSDYVLGTDRFAISIAYAYQNKILAGLIYSPVKNTFFFAQKNKGAYKITGRRKEKLILAFKPIKKSSISLNSSFDKTRAIQMFKLAVNVIPHVFQVRMQGCVVLSLMSIAENKFQANINGHCRVWDIAAAKLILEEAGGAILDWQGLPLKYNFKDAAKTYEIAAGRPDLLKQILKYT
jgi:myo-inositol-1(or 4)-monophosphatase